MDIKAYRRQRLNSLIEDESGTRTRFCKKRGLTYQSISNMLSESGDGFGDRAARMMEVKLGLPTFYFDEGGPNTPSIGTADALSSELLGPGREVAERSGGINHKDLAEALKALVASDPKLFRDLIAAAMAPSN